MESSKRTRKKRLKLDFDFSNGVVVLIFDVERNPIIFPENVEFFSAEYNTEST